MSEKLKTAEESGAIADRRAFPRIQVRSLAYIELDEGNGGLILNISEGGIAVQAAELLVGDFFGNMRFRLPKAQNWIQTTGKIAWQGRSRKEAGIRFIDLPGDTQRQIHDWIYSAAFSPNLLTEKGRFKILWEAETQKSESDIPELAANDVPSEFDAIFPSEQSLAPARVLNVRETRPAAETSSQENLTNREPGKNLESRTEESGAKVSLGTVEDELPSSCIADAIEGLSPSSSVTGHAPESSAQPDSEELQGENQPLLPRSVDVRRYSSPFAAVEVPASPASNRAYGTPFSPYEGEVANSQSPSRKTHILTGVLCFAAGLVLALLIVAGPSGLKNRLSQFYKVSVASVAPSSPESAPPSPSAPVPPESADDSIQHPLTAPSSPGPPLQESAPPKSNTPATVPAEPNGPGSPNATESAAPEALRLKPPQASKSAAEAIETRDASENEPGGKEPGPPANQVLASPTQENPPHSERTLDADAYAQQERRAPVSPAVSEPPPAETVQAPPVAEPPLEPSASREPQIPMGTAAISSHFHSVRNAPESDPEAPAPILRIGQLASIRQPVYPPEAAKQRIEGVVKLRAAVAQNGVVERVELVSGPPGLVAAAIDAVRDWRYDPTLLDGHPVESLEDITVVFRMANSTPSPR